jgi:hypothetical protein
MNWRSAAVCWVLAAPLTLASADSRKALEEPAQISHQSPEQLRAAAESIDGLRKELESQNRRAKPARESLSRQIQLTLQEAKVLIALGQALSIAPAGQTRPKKSSPQDVSSADQQALQGAGALLTDLLNHPAAGAALSPTQRGVVFRLRGTAAYALSDYAAALKDFERALENDPSSSESGWTAFMAAEEYFEISQFSRSAELYQLAQSRSQPGSRTWELSRYKLAWCWVNLEKISDAERTFLEMIRNSKDELLAQDSARDLAFVLARVRNEKQLLEIYEQKLSKTGARGLAFLRKALATLERQGQLGVRSGLRDRVLELTADPAARVAVLLDSVQGVSREYASKAHAQRTLEVLKVVEALQKTEPLSSEILEPLEAASERVCKVFSETYAGRTKTPENFTRSELAHQLQALFQEHLRVFAASTKKAKLQEFWLEVCELENDTRCLMALSEQMIRDDQYPEDQLQAVRQRAKDAQLVALERLQSANGGSYRVQYKKALTERLADPHAQRGAVAGAKLAQLQVEEKDYAGAVQTLGQVLKREPSHLYWYSYKWAQLQAGDFLGVMAGPEALELKNLSGAPDPRLRAVLAEASLKLASGARNSDDFKAMAAHLQKFEQLSDDLAKVQSARDEWVAALLSKKLHGEAIRKISEFPLAWQQRSGAGQLKSRLLLQVIEEGEFGLFGKWMLHVQDPNVALLGLLYWGGAKSIGFDRVKALDSTQRSLWLGAAVLTNPDWVDRYFTKYPGGDRPIADLARRFLGKPPLGGSNAPGNSPLTEYEKSAARVSLGRPQRGAQSVKLTQKVIEAVKLHRKKMVAALKGQLPRSQVRILSAQRRLEEGAVQLILQSPVPKGLRPEQLAEYQEGLKQLASDHSAQIQQLEEARVKIELKADEQKRAQEAEDAAKTLPALSAPDRIVPSGQLRPEATAKNVVRMVRASNLWGALMELERLKAKKAVDGEDYWRLRAWVIASPRGPGAAPFQQDILFRYVHDELTDAGMQQVIEDWKKK